MKSFQNILLAFYLFLAVLALGSLPAYSQVYLSIGFAPPLLPLYSQPPCPDDGYIWTPGYWACGEYGYYWVPGTWVQPPEIGLFWTPCYWGWDGNRYHFHSGYWGQNVGYYGGINYGYGYGGNGYGGGRWERGHFAYNTAVNNVSSTHVHNTYINRTVINSNAGRVSYNGGRGGVQAQPTAQQTRFSGQRHFQATSVQQAHVRSASQDRSQLAAVNGGRPATLAVVRPQAYATIARQHAKTQPLTAQDRTRAVAASAKSGTPASSNRQITAAKPTRLAAQNTQALPSHQIAAKPKAQSVTHPAPLPRPVVHTAPQPRPVVHTAPQSRPVVHTAPQPRPVVHTAPQPRPVAQGAPQSHPIVHTASHSAASAKP